MLALAVGLGGISARDGFSAFMRAVLPSAIMEAQADVQGPAREIVLPLHLPAEPSRFAPQVLTPLPSRGLPDWLVERAKYARLVSGGPQAFVPASRAPAIAIVIDDLGNDAAATERAIALPAAVTLSFLPYADATPVLARLAHRAGHQLMVHVPMEPEGNQDPGPMALRTDQSAGEVIRRLDWALARVPFYSGINNHMGSRFTQDRMSLIPVVEDLEDSKAFFLDSRTAPGSAVIPLARAFGVASAGRDVFLDDVLTEQGVDAQLARTERMARETGVAIVIGHPHAVTLDALKAWTAHIMARGYRLVPASAAIRLRTEQDALQISLATPGR